MHNHCTFHHRPGQEYELLQMDISPDCEETLKEVLEIEMLQGERLVLPGGRILYTIEVEASKAKLLRQALITAIYELNQDKNRN